MHVTLPPSMSSPILVTRAFFPPRPPGKGLGTRMVFPQSTFSVLRVRQRCRQREIKRPYRSPNWPMLDKVLATFVYHISPKTPRRFSKSMHLPDQFTQRNVVLEKRNQPLSNQKIVTGLAWTKIISGLNKNAPFLSISAWSCSSR